MTSGPYERKPGEFEIRILADGRVVFIGPDEKMMEISKAVAENAPEDVNEVNQQKQEVRDVRDE